MYHVAVILTDANKRILWVNEDFTAITGYALNEVVGKSPGALLQGPETEPEAVQRIREGLTKQQSLKESVTNYRRNGEKYTCKLVIHPIFDPKKELSNYIAFEVDEAEVQDQPEIPLLELSPKYHSSSLKGLGEIKLYTRVKILLEQERLYLNPDLGLKEVAEKLDTNTKYLSQVVNRCSGQNFQQFINAYRVKAIKKEIAGGKYQYLTLFGVAQQCGFKNKSTFYKVFKDLSGITPREFIDQLD